MNNLAVVYIQIHSIFNIEALKFGTMINRASTNKLCRWNILMYMYIQCLNNGNIMTNYFLLPNGWYNQY